MGLKKKTLLEELKARFPRLPEKELYARIVCGEVRVDGETIREPRRPCRSDGSITLVPKKKYVSRGGEKLAGALEDTRIDCTGRVFLDAGASTGGFTDCLLAHGAALVYAVDVGHAQFDFSLRQDPRVRVMERTNVMSLEREMFSPPPEAAVIDLSFRSLAGIARRLLDLVTDRWALALVKPQFEWVDPPSSFDGIVRDDQTRKMILTRCAERLYQEGVAVTAASVSRISGAKGNVEFFFLLKGAPAGALRNDAAIIEHLFDHNG
jgi:23S rRNA (cytidine1920-2'-O)/16S rRNA (cytidine1409-2'-O)-methyltransferase